MWTEEWNMAVIQQVEALEQHLAPDKEDWSKMCTQQPRYYIIVNTHG